MAARRFPERENDENAMWRRLQGVPRAVGYLEGGRFCPYLSMRQPPDLRFQRLAWYPEFRGRSGRSGNPPMALGESRFDHLHFTICQCRKTFVRAMRFGRFASLASSHPRRKCRFHSG